MVKNCCDLNEALVGLSEGEKIGSIIKKIGQAGGEEDP